MGRGIHNTSLLFMNVMYDLTSRSTSQFMVVTETEFLLVEPDKSKIGWGVVHFISFLQVK